MVSYLIVKRSVRVFLVLFLLLVHSSLSSKTTESNSNGDWTNSGTWDNGVPACGDTVIVGSGTTVDVNTHINLDVNSGCSSPMYLEVRGVLDFSNGKKLYLPCNSYVFITATGDLVKGNGGGNSNLIQICEVTVWNAGTGSVPGPAPIGPGLPIELVSFTGKVDGDRIVFNWITASEINNDFFTIERTIDLKNYTSIVDIPGSGNSREYQYYEAIDNNPLRGISYYRLKQTDFNGARSYSDVIAIDFKGSRKSTYSVFPSLVKDGQITINVDEEAGTKIQANFYNSEGKLLLQKHFHCIEGQNLYHFNISELSNKNIILVRVSSHHQSASSKIIITDN